VKMNRNQFIVGLSLVAALAMPVPPAAQEQQHQHQKKEHTRYKLIDLGTFGGPQSYVTGDGSGTSLVLNNQGTLTGSADTSTPDPYSPSCFNEDCFVSHAFQWKNSVMSDLGALPGGASSASTWISSNGLIAGLSENGEIDPLISGLPEVRAVVWKEGKITDLGTLPEGGYESVANAVNSRGQVVGLASNTIPDPDSMAGLGYQTRAFFWQHGAMQDIGTLGGTDAQAFFINEQGQVVGISYTSSAPGACAGANGLALTTNSFIWDVKHGMEDIGSLGGTCTVAAGLNNKGQVIAQSFLPGDQSISSFLWENGSLHELGGSFGGSFTAAEAINDQGEIAGAGYLPGDNAFHAALWRSVESITDLGVVSSDSCSFAASINVRTQVVGASAPDCIFDTSSAVRAFLWEEGSMFDLNTLIPAGSPLYLQFTETINDRGEIAGTGVDAGGNVHAFLLMPCGQDDMEGCKGAAADITEATRTDATRVSLDPPAMHLPPDNQRYSVNWLFRQRIGVGRFVRKPQKAVLRRPAAISGPNATLSPTSVTFATQLVGSSSSVKSITLSNHGTATLSITGITSSGDFSQTHTCGSSLAAGAGCTINVTFKPTHTGTRTGTLSVTDSAPGSPQAVSLSGTGSVVKLAPASLIFATQLLNTSSQLETVTVTNTATTSLNITGTVATGDFSQSRTCGSLLSGGASCTILVSFRPTQIGKRTGTLSIADNGGGSPQVVPLSGIGTVVKLAPASLTFATQVVNTTSAPQSVTMTNTAATSLSIVGIAASGDFVQNDNCGSSLAGGASCSISVSFKPTQSGTRTGTLSIADNGGSPQTVALVGTAGTMITSGAPPGGTVGKLYYVRCSRIPFCIPPVAGFPLTAAGGVQPYFWSWAGTQGSSLPPGLNISELCLGSRGPTICGTPTAAGTYKVIVTVTDSGSPATHASADYTITISP
jgi:probable HAF family extracellular repeat protein